MIKTYSENLQVGDEYYELSQYSMWERSKEGEFVYYKTSKDKKEIYTFRIRKCLRTSSNSSSFKYLLKNEVTEEIKKALNIED